jgi:hypothetical protein
MYSERFQKEIQITDHAYVSMAKRDITEAVLLDTIETGEIKPKDERHLWIHKHIADRHDNLLCVAAVDGAALIVKTVMTDWSIKEIPR